MTFDNAMRHAGFGSQTEVAKYFGTNFGTVNRWRCGRRSVPRVVATVFELRRNPSAILRADFVADLLVEVWKRGEQG